MLGGLASALALTTPRKWLNLYEDTTQYLTYSALILLIYYSILAVGGVYCFRVPHNRTRGGTPELLRMTLGTAMATVAIAVMFILFGAPISSQHMATLIAALNVALLGVTPAILTVKPTVENWRRALLASPFGLATVPEQWASGFFWSTMITCWIFAYFIPLDWDRPWQKWPLPILGGAYLGNLIGLLVVLLRCLVLPVARADFLQSEEIRLEMVRDQAAVATEKKTT